jgi:hypothetical protein
VQPPPRAANEAAINPYRPSNQPSPRTHTSRSLLPDETRRPASLLLPNSNRDTTGDRSEQPRTPQHRPTGPANLARRLVSTHPRYICLGRSPTTTPPQKSETRVGAIAPTRVLTSASSAGRGPKYGFRAYCRAVLGILDAYWCYRGCRGFESGGGGRGALVGWGVSWSGRPWLVCGCCWFRWSGFGWSVRCLGCGGGGAVRGGCRWRG